MNAFSKGVILLCGVIAINFNLFAQQTFTINGNLFKDAVVYKDTRPGYEYLADNNYGNYTRISATAWTHSGKNTYWRTLLYFNLDSIPVGSTINSATLYLYSDPTVTSSSAANGNSQLSGSNAFYIEKVLEEWDESTLTWNNQPTTTTTGRVWVGPSSSPTENIQISLKNMIQDWVNDPISNNGLKMTLENELKYRSRNYGSKDHSNASIHPKLVISYSTATALEESCDTPDPTEEEYTNLPWYGNETFFNNVRDSIEAIYGSPTVPLRVTGDVETPIFRIPIKFWVYQISTGNPGGNFPNLFPQEIYYQRALDDLNEAAKFNGLDIRFYMKDVTFVNSPNSLEMGGVVEQTTLALLFRDGDAMNIHVIDHFKKAGRAGLYNSV